LVALVLEHSLRDLPQLMRHAIADVLPRAGELRPNLPYGRVIERVVEGSQAPGRLLAQSRVSVKERFDKLLALSLEFVELDIDCLYETNGKQMNAGLERKAHVVKVASQVAVEPTDCLEFRGIQKGFRHTDEVLICVHLNLRRTYLPTVPQCAESNLHEDRLSREIFAWRFKVNDH